MIGQSEKNDHILMSLVAHGFGRVEFRISNICSDFFKCTHMKRNKKKYSMSYQGHKPKTTTAKKNTLHFENILFTLVKY